MSLKNEIRQLNIDLQALLEKLEQLEMQVDSLEAQNNRLLNKVSQGELLSEGEAELRKLYEEGFHICPTHYAKQRENAEDCLLCLAFLQNGNQKELNK